MHSTYERHTTVLVKPTNLFYVSVCAYSVLTQARNVELSKSTPKLAAAKTALARVTARAEQASENQADLRASLTTGASSIDHFSPCIIYS